MIILGIETSCDETSASVVRNGREILSQVISSSLDIHTLTGGVIPEVAAREQIKAMLPVLEQALSEANLKPQDLDAIAVTAGPGLIGSLLVGVETAKTLSLVWNKPIIPINHLPGHLYANWLTEGEEPKFPAIGLVISGGHTDLVLMKKHGDVEFIGGTRDDAAGEAFDKTARLLGLPYPGGPSISKAALEWSGEKSITLPRPLLDEKSFEFSFSGLKTAVLREVNKLNEIGQLEENISQVAHEVQEAIVEVVVRKTLSAVKQYTVQTLLIAGGVAANSRLKERFQDSVPSNVVLHIPSPKLCTDNATFIASCAFFNQKTTPWSEVNANPSLQITDVIK